MHIAILGAECTGKTQLAQALVERLQAEHPGTAWLPEFLRTWCDQEGRTPRAEEQAAIAATQWAQLQALAANAPATGLVLCDTSPLMTAIYSDILFGDSTLYAQALEQQRSFTLTLVTGLDLPWEADGIQRSSAAMRAQVDQRLRTVLQANGLPYSSVYGTGQARVHNALQAITYALGQRPPQTASRWKWLCDKCSDPGCEHRLFQDLQAQP
jgi:nicotinamide riboside kinase